MPNNQQEDFQKAIKILAEKIINAVRVEIENAHFDKTSTARVVAKNANNYYTVEFNGNKITVKGSANAAFNIGDYVKVNIPQNNIKNAFIIPKTGNNRDPNDSSQNHSHSNLSVLDRITNSMVDAIKKLGELAFEDSVSIDSLDSNLKNQIDKIEEQVQSDWNVSDTASKAFIKNKPSIPDPQVQADWNETNKTSKAFIKNKPTIPAEQVQSDWNEKSEDSMAFIKNKPFIPSSVDDLKDGTSVMMTDKIYILRGGNAASYP